MFFLLFTQTFRLDGVNYEAELIAQCLVSVGHADLGHVGPADVVPLWSVFQVVHPDKVLLILQTNSELLHYSWRRRQRLNVMVDQRVESVSPHLVGQSALEHTVPSYFAHVACAELPQLGCNRVLLHQWFLGSIPSRIFRRDYLRGSIRLSLIMTHHGTSDGE